MEFIKKYRHILILLLFVLLFGKHFIRPVGVLRDFTGEGKSESIIVKDYKNQWEIDKKNYDKVEAMLLDQSARKVDTPLMRKAFNNAITIIFKSNDKEYEYSFISNKKMKASYWKDGIYHEEYYRLVRDFDFNSLKALY
ncbi:MAG: hypothetical protein ACTHWZ_06460 [Peptoniphilaceae bacterium]